MGDTEERRNLSLCVKSVFQTFHQYYTFLENKTKLNISQLSHEIFPQTEWSVQCIAQTFVQLCSLSHKIWKAARKFWITYSPVLWEANINSGVPEDFRQPNLAVSSLFSYSCISLLAAQAFTGKCFRYQTISKSAVCGVIPDVSCHKWNI